MSTLCFINAYKIGPLILLLFIHYCLSYCYLPLRGCVCLCPLPAAESWSSIRSTGSTWSSMSVGDFVSFSRKSLHFKLYKSNYFSGVTSHAGVTGNGEWGSCLSFCKSSLKSVWLWSLWSQQTRQQQVWVTACIWLQKKIFVGSSFLFVFFCLSPIIRISGKPRGLKYSSL